MKTTIIAAVALAAMASGASGQATTSAQGSAAAPHPGRRVTITYENVTSGQTFSPAVFVTHDAGAPKLFEEGQPASFGMMRIAEEGNAGPLLSADVVPMLTGAFGTAVTAISTLPGQTRSVEIEVSREHPLLSGAMMLVMTNDGFTGIGAVDAYALTAPLTLDLMAMDAGTENNNETAPHLVAMKGTGRDPESGVVRPHQGIRADADAPASWKFDPAMPVGRITIAPSS